ncbi:uncharacterized protein LOC130667966 [Microplitis mediator]|uniref:uncharacterized protein LOC130667966 n=1 Tax=Microplitis mediator TaxID=375433 RepID=UPI002554A5F3|nr:uncharacterized protein LOC130667966 [Microplitis mediator]
MCLPRTFVIVIVKSRDGRRTRFKYINVREVSTMVARLPQQVLLFLVLVTTVTSGSTDKKQEPERSIMVTKGKTKSLDKETSISSWQNLLESVISTPREFYPTQRPEVSDSNILSQKMVSFVHINALNDITEKTSYITHNHKMEKVIDLSEHRVNKKIYKTDSEFVGTTIFPFTKGSLVNRISFQSVPSQLATPERKEARLTRLSGFRATTESSAGIEEKAMGKFSQGNSVGIEKYGGNVLRTLDATTETTEVNSISFGSRIQMNLALTVAGIDDETPQIFQNHSQTENNIEILSHATDLYSTIPPLQFQSGRVVNQVKLVSTSVTTKSTVKENIKKEHQWLSTQPNISLEVAQTSESTLSTTAVSLPRRYMRDISDSSCDKFKIGDEAKQEFYSPNYPHNYPPLQDCVRILEADKGMLIKLDFRDYFELEAPMTTSDKDPECAFDYFEVRDGFYGFSTPIGNFCDKNFPPEITSRTRYLWLRFHSDDTIEYKGFKAIWSQVPRPTYPGVPPEPEPCIKYVTEEAEALINNTAIEEEKKIAIKNNVPLDCLWVIRAKEKWRMQLTFESFKLDKPNDCDANFLSVFDKETEMNALVKNFCGSIAETVNTKSNIMYIRFYLEIKAINSSFRSLMTAIRDKEPNVQSCKEDEYDCDDATCIAGFLRCNGRENCRLKWDEDQSICLPSQGAINLESTRIIIILVIFSLIMFAMCFSFIFNCVHKLVRDHRIIKEHIRMSRENRLDEIGRKATPCPLSQSQTDIHQCDSESPSLELETSKDLVPGATLIAHEYTKELVLEMNYGAREINDIHQSNNVSNATQERLQESNDEPEMCDSSCQTRESLFDPRISIPRVSSPAFSTFGYRSVGSSQNGVGTSTRKASQDQMSPQSPKQSITSTVRTRPPSESCSICNSDVRGHVSNDIICSNHTTIPAPPGWSVHEPNYLPLNSMDVGTDSDYPSYHRYQSPKPERIPPGFKESMLSRQATIGSGERYGSLYGSGRGSSNTHSNPNSSQNSNASKCPHSDPRYRAEAIIEVDQKRPFSIESTKSAPDVIATH